MTDRFKFRAWNKETKTMHYEVEQTYDCLMGIPIVYRSSFGDVLYDEDYIVEQCTGLKDKNSKLIYEGDVVKVYSYKAVVVWDCHGWYLKLGDVLNSFSNYHNVLKTFEVVGNIHENEELLK